MKFSIALAAALSFGIANAALAVPVGGTGNVTNNVIFGSGNANGSFTGIQSNGLELALRGKLRYNLAGVAENTFNYDGDHTYQFDPANSVAPANRSIFNFEWSINTDFDGSAGGRKIGDLSYQLSMSGPGVTAAPFDPYAVLFADHSFGDNGTAQGAGAEATGVPSFFQLKANNNLSQQSWNLGFGFSGTPQANGTYTFNLEAFNGMASLGSTSIDVIVGAVPLPAGVPLMAAVVGALAFFARRSDGKAA